jgi:PAS domain S-box-containing protein
MTEEAGRVTGIFCQGFDVTQEHLAQEALRESEARLRLALEAGRLAEVTFHIQDGSVTHSPAYAQLLGHPPDATVTLDQIRLQYHPEDRERVLRERQAILDGDREFYEVEKRVVWPDGQVR